ncbi:MAG: hydroxymethylpyrimidine/phosphomethylpyrimidine kinase [Candidatus Thiodiazotropha sp. (ex Myrtea sp. 'scaly one' KF741663)]|nr:hydroxymethylpyrimidine/phosphomethylpyrimidine kinase [Candidatus Thiodiazotropha sp. (ex Myrtea sp. 'scaly one' KF741663)]
MQEESSTLPVVLAIGGHDPCGGAGIQADIEAIAANGAHAATIVTCLTVQDSCNVLALHPVAAETISAQAVAIFQDAHISAIKIGLLGSPGATEAVIRILRSHPKIPVILDPVLAAGGGNRLAGEQILRLMCEELLPLCDLITPNTHEARHLSNKSESATMEECARHLLAFGAGSVLITGTHDALTNPEITHRLFIPDESAVTSTCQRLPGEYHGSGCTLASAIAAHLAHQEPLQTAIEQALDYSWKSLRHGFRIGRCQSLPDRLFRLTRQPSMPNE